MKGSFSGTERYELRRQLGEGGFGVVYEVFDRQRQESIALKTMRHLDPRALYRFKQEFRSLANVSHPNLVGLYELVAKDDLWFFTMELVSGVDFLTYVREPAVEGAPGATASGEDAADAAGGVVTGDEKTQADGRTMPMYAAPPPPAPPPPAPRARPRTRTHRRVDPAVAQLKPFDEQRLRDALRQLAAGVHALHCEKMLHRDLKPPNVLVTTEGRVVLLDFGLVHDVRLEHTVDQEVVGTASYMAPEQAMAGEIGEAADWYAVGVMLYETLAGQLPFKGELFQVMLAKQNHDPPPVSNLAPASCADLSALCMELLRRDPRKRPLGEQILDQLHAQREEVTGRITLPDVARPTASLLVGREPQLAALQQAFAASATAPVVACVSGASGMGKSALAERFLEDLAAGPKPVVLAGRCYQQETVPYKAVDGLVDALCRHLIRLDDAEVAQLLPRDVRAISRLFPVLDRVDAIAKAPDRTTGVVNDKELQDRGFAALKELFARMTDRHRLVLVIDDLQWGDLDSARLLVELLRPPDAPATLLLACHRAEAKDAPCLRFLDEHLPATGVAVHEVEVGLLPEEVASRLAHVLVGNDPALRPLAHTIGRESAGNPFFITELVRYATTVKADSPSLDTDISLISVLNDRVRRLPEEARALLETIAVAGKPISAALALEAAGQGREAQATLARTNLIRSCGSSAEDLVECFHDRIRETVVESLSADELRRRHTRLAATLEARKQEAVEALVVHFEGAGLAERASRYAAEAAALAAKALAFERAASLYRKALAREFDDPAERRTLQRSLARALVNAGRGPEAAQAYLAAAEGASAQETLELQQKAAEQLMLSGSIEDGVALLGTVLETVGLKLQQTPRSVLATLLTRRARLRLRGLKFKERSLEALPEQDRLRIDAAWAVTKGLSLVNGIQGSSMGTLLLLLALKSGAPRAITLALGLEASFTATSGGSTIKRTAALLETTQQLAARIGDPYLVEWARVSSGSIAFLQGRWADSVRDCDEAEKILSERCVGTTWEQDTAHIFALASLYPAGRWKEIASRVPRLMRSAVERRDLYFETWLRVRFTAAVALLNDDPARAREETDGAIERWPAPGFTGPHWWNLFTRVNTRLYEGDYETAWREVCETLPLAKRALQMAIQVHLIDALHMRASAALALASTLTAEDARRKTLLARAEKDARKLEGMKMPWPAAVAQRIRGTGAFLRGDPERAVALLAAAAETYDGVDMVLYAAATRCAQGTVIGGDEGRALIAAAERRIAEEGAVRPDRLAAMFAPGFTGRAAEGSG